MTTIFAYLTNYNNYIIIAFAICLFILLIWNLIITIKFNKLKNRFTSTITNYSENFNLEDMLCKTVSEVSEFRKELNENVKICADANNKTNEKFDKKIENLHNLFDGESKIIREMIDVINSNISICIQKTSVVRYNPFENVGGELCFALAALDKKNNGFIINTIFTEVACYTYCKPVIDGTSTIKLSKEEQQSLDLAKNKIS